jgi:hypothetical protein
MFAMPIQIATTCAVLTSLVVSAARADEKLRPAELDLRTDRVIVFKDGYCLVMKQGIATTNPDGQVFTEDVPDAAILGSFWAIPENATIKSIVAGWVETESSSKRELTCTNTIEIVKANLGKQCSFTIDNRETHHGKLIKVLSNDDVPDDDSSPAVAHIADPFAAVGHIRVDRPQDQSPPVAGTTVVSRSQITGDYFVLQTDAGDMMVPAGSVSKLTIEGMETTREQTVNRLTRQKRLTMQFAEPNTPVKINLMYFRPDVRWIPTYRINLTDRQPVSTRAAQKTAEIFMQGEILNEAEDFTGVPFHVVVGVPNFRFRDIPSPMVLEASLRNLLAQAAPDVMGNANFMSNALYTQRASEFQSNRAAGIDARATVELPVELTGSAGNDLYVYELGKLTLKQGERATVPILRTEVAYRDVYTWDIEITHAENYAASSAGAPSPLILTENRVWRQIELINDTEIPWTTGAAMFVDGFQPLAQELLTYTSPGGICRVPVTVAVDLKGRVEDGETKRELNAIKWQGYEYARVLGKIDIELANNKTETVPVEVKLRFGGTAKETSNDGKIALESFRAEDWRDQRGSPVNNSSVVRWNADIKPGECFKPTVGYEFFLKY